MFRCRIKFYLFSYEIIKLARIIVFHTYFLYLYHLSEENRRKILAKNVFFL